MFGIQASVLIVAVFTAFVGYQFRVREKKRESSYSELLKSYNEVYSPLSFRLREINVLPTSNDKQALMEKLFLDFGLNSSKAHLIGSVKMLEVYLELNTLFNAYKHEPSVYEENFLRCLKDFEKLINEEFWDAHNIIYKEHLRYKDYHFRPVKALFIDIIGTIKFISELAISVSVFFWVGLILQLLNNSQAVSHEFMTFAISITISIVIMYVLSLIYSLQFYNQTSNLYRKKKKKRSVEGRL